MTTQEAPVDLLIVGAGPAGLAAAIAAQRAGLSHEILEKGAIANSIFHFPRNQVFFTTPELLEIGGLPFVTPYEKPTRIEALRYYRRVVETFGLKLALGIQVTAIRVEAGAQGTRFAVETRETPPAARSGFAGAGGPSAGLEQDRGGPSPPPRHARNVVVACGYYDRPNLLGVPGEGLPHVSHYYAEAHAYYGQRVAVVGGKNSAALAALDLHRHGARVTLIHRRKQLSDSIKYWIRPDIENRLKQGSIAVRFETRLIEIEPRALTLEGPAGRERLEADAVFLLTGYHPDDALLRGAGVRVDPDSFRPFHDESTFETDVPGLFVAGSVVSGRETNKTFIENGRFHGERIVASILASRGSL
ncbi:MAG: YpdA family putative bacillithiol disulfide reductase [Vicinamibacteria bacterium]